MHIFPEKTQFWNKSLAMEPSYSKQVILLCLNCNISILFFLTAMALAALPNYKFPFRNVNKDEAAQKLQRKLRRNIRDQFLQDLDTHWFTFKRTIQCQNLPQFIIKAHARQQQQQQTTS